MFTNSKLILCSYRKVANHQFITKHYKSQTKKGNNIMKTAIEIEKEVEKEVRKEERVREYSTKQYWIALRKRSSI